MRTMRPWLEPRNLLAAAIAATAGVLLGRHGGTPLAISVVVAACIGLCLVTAGPWLCAVPAALASAMPSCAPCDLPRSGPVSVDAAVVRVVGRDLAADRCVVEIEQRGRLALCAADGTTGLLPGDRLAGVARLSDSRPARPGHVAWLETHVDAVTCSHGPTSPRRLATAWRHAFEERMLAHFDGPAAALLCHLTLARGPRIEDEIVAAHCATGLVHLLAVSGAHASMLAWMIGLGFRLLTGRDPWNARGYRMFCIGFLLAYGSITEWEPPMFRALAAFALFVAATARGRRTNVTAALALPALLTAWLTPDDFGSVSFCLSYAAVAGLGVSGVFQRGGFVGLRSAITASLWATLLTAPLTLVYFGQLAPWTILATPLLGPLVAAMLGGSIVVATFGDWIGAAIAPPTQLVAELYVLGVEWTSGLPGAPMFATGRPPESLLWAIAVVALALVCWIPSRIVLAAGCVALCAPHFWWSRLDAAALTLCAVGHGSAALIATGSDEVVLVDCGSLGDGRAAARSVGRALGTRRRIDVAVVSHADHDHFGGLAELARDHPIGRAVLPADLRGSRVARALEQRGVGLEWLVPGTDREVADGVRLFVPAVDGATTNDRSAWVDARVAGLRIVLPGDAAALGIDAWLASAAAGPVDVLVLPHHGRGDPDDLVRLLADARPTVCLVSNRNGEHASPLGAFARSRGHPVFETGTRGTLRVLAGDPATLDCERAWPIPRVSR